MRKNGIKGGKTTYRVYKKEANKIVVIEVWKKDCIKATTQNEKEKASNK